MLNEMKERKLRFISIYERNMWIECVVVKAFGCFPKVKCRFDVEAYHLSFFCDETKKREINK